MSTSISIPSENTHQELKGNKNILKEKLREIVKVLFLKNGSKFLKTRKKWQLQEVCNFRKKDEWRKMG